MPDRTKIDELPESSSSSTYFPSQTLNQNNRSQNNQNQNNQYQYQNFNEMKQVASRDIVVNPTNFTNDVQVQPNYIPHANNMQDYIKNSQEDQNELNQLLCKKKKTSKKINSIFTYAYLQDSIVMATLFFIFQMSIVNSIIKLYTTSLGIFYLDGSYNKKGMVFKSLLFSMLYSIYHSSKSVLIKCL